MAKATVRDDEVRGNPQNQNSDGLPTRGTRGKVENPAQTRMDAGFLESETTRGKPGANPGQTRGRPGAEREERENSFSIDEAAGAGGADDDPPSYLHRGSLDELFWLAEGSLTDMQLEHMTLMESGSQWAADNAAKVLRGIAALMGDLGTDTFGGQGATEALADHFASTFERVADMSRAASDARCALARRQRA